MPPVKYYRAKCDPVQDGLIAVLMTQPSGAIRQLSLDLYPMHKLFYDWGRVS